MGWEEAADKRAAYECVLVIFYNASIDITFIHHHKIPYIPLDTNVMTSRIINVLYNHCTVSHLGLINDSFTLNAH